MSAMTDPLPAWLPLLRKPYEDILSSRASWDLALPDRTPVHVERGSQGFNNAVYRVAIKGATFTCKLFVVDERQRAEREWAAICAAQESGELLAPVPVAFAPEGPLPQPAIISQWVEGASLTAERLTASQLDDLVLAVARIHRIRPAAGLEFLTAWHQPANFTDYLAEARGFLDPVRAWAAGVAGQTRDLPSWVADLPELLPLIEVTLDDAEREARAAGPTIGGLAVPALIRIDGNLDNVLRRADGRLIFVDWEYSGWGDPAFDLAELRWHPRTLNIAQADWEAALNAYPAPADDADFRRRLAVYSHLLPVWWVARSALYLLEGIGQTQGRKRLVRLPARVFRQLRGQLDGYLVALGLIEREDAEADEDD
jgi:aminoglycoside phosphotransferase (APT) family kinase protein